MTWHVCQANDRTHHSALVTTFFVDVPALRCLSLMLLSPKAAGPYLRTVRHSSILAVAMLLKVKVREAADVTNPIYKDGVVSHKLQDGICAVGQGEVEHKGGEQDTGHLLHKLAGLRTMLATVTLAANISAGVTPAVAVSTGVTPAFAILAGVTPAISISATATSAATVL